MDPLVISRPESVNLRIEKNKIFSNITFRDTWILLVGLTYLLSMVLSLVPDLRFFFCSFNSTENSFRNRLKTQNTMDMWTFSTLAIFITVVTQFLSHLCKIFFSFHVWNVPFREIMSEISDVLWFLELGTRLFKFGAPANFRRSWCIIFQKYTVLFGKKRINLMLISKDYL